MPAVPEDKQLLLAVRELVRDRRGQAAAARHLGMPRLRINRLLKQKGAVTDRVRAEFWEAFEKAGNTNADTSSRSTASEPIQVIRDVPAVAIQVIRYMAQAVERERHSEGEGEVHGTSG